MPQQQQTRRDDAQSRNTMCKEQCIHYQPLQNVHVQRAVRLAGERA
jgi:hypothetical protein